MLNGLDMFVKALLHLLSVGLRHFLLCFIGLSLTVHLLYILPVPALNFYINGVWQWLPMEEVIQWETMILFCSVVGAFLVVGQAVIMPCNERY